MLSHNPQNNHLTYYLHHNKTLIYNYIYIYIAPFRVHVGTRVGPMKVKITCKVSVRSQLLTLLEHCVILPLLHELHYQGAN